MSLTFNSACCLHIVVTIIVVCYLYVHEQFAMSLHFFVFPLNLTKSAKSEPLLTRSSSFLWLKKSNHRVTQIDISESTDIDQSISMNQFYPIEALIFI